MNNSEIDRPQHTECCKSLGAIEDALYVIGGKWKLKITLALMEGNKRFNEIQRLLKPISARVLSHELKELELNGFITRKVYATATPVVVEYEATEYSFTLRKVLDALVEWGTIHKQMIKEIPALPIARN